MKKLLAIAAIAAMALTANAQHSKDWGQLHKYAGPNIELNNHKNNGKRVVLLGNSITENWVTKHPDFFKQTGYIGRGISGQTSYQFLVRFREDVVNLNPKVVVINVGTNDIAENTGPYNEEHTFNNVKAMCDLARFHKIKVILCSTLPHKGFGWRPSVTDAMPKIRSLNERVKAYAKENKIPYVDYFSAMVSEDGTQMRPELSEDGVHPNLEGYAIMESLVMPVIKKLR